MAEEYELDATEGGNGVESTVKTDGAVEVDPARAALVADIIKEIKADKKHHDAAFKRMRQCVRLAANGTLDDGDGEAADGSFVVPITNRLINQAVASLYAKNPTAIAKRKQKLLYQLWDGDTTSLQAAGQAVQQMAQAGTVLDPVTGQPVQTPEMALVTEAAQVKQQIIMYDRMAKTMGLLFSYYLEEQDSGYKEQFKAWVRRAKVCGAAPIDLDFQRIMKQNPDVAAAIADTTPMIATIEAKIAGLQEAGQPFDQESAEAERLRLMLEDLQTRTEIIAREGPVLSFPRAWEIIPDRECRHLKTFAGARRVSREYELTPERIREVYGVDVGQNYTPYSTDGAMTDDRKNAKCKVWRVQDKQRQQVYVVCDGYPDFLVTPAEPDVRIERFWTTFMLVLNEVESDDDKVSIYPPSDVWNSRHMQREYNAARQGRREHRIAARPWWAVMFGKLADKDKNRLGSKAAFEVVELESMNPGERVEDVLQAGPTAGIDPNLYETETTFADLQRATGTQEANFGGTSGDTATEASIAENSRSATNASDVDDLDTVLTALARGMGQLMLTELSKETVIEIAGPGAVWPDVPPTREQISKDLILEVVAGSSGRPNKAADLANMERGMPYITMLPGINPEPLAKKYLDVLDINADDAYVEGLPSIVAVNQMVGKAASAGAGPNAPEQQGDQGANNAPGPEQRNEPGSQPAFPAPGEAGLSH